MIAAKLTAILIAAASTVGVTSSNVTISKRPAPSGFAFNSNGLIFVAGDADLFDVGITTPAKVTCHRVTRRVLDSSPPLRELYWEICGHRRKVKQ